MIYREVLPSKSLQDIVQNYWTFQVFERTGVSFPLVHETLPENTISLVVINQPYFKGVRVMGPHTLKYSQSIFPNSIFVGIRFQPWITIKTLTPKKSDILNDTCDTSVAVQKQFKQIQIESGFNDFKALEACIAVFLNEQAVEKNDMVKFICLQLTYGKPIPDVISKIPASTRVIQKKFKEVTGITMKQYTNVERQRNTWKAIVLENKNQLEAILDNGFYDQSHFINEFKKIMKRTHTDFQSYLSSVQITYN